MRLCILTERMRLGFGVDLVVDEQARRLAALGYEVVVAVVHADLIQPAREYELIVIDRILHAADYRSETGVKRILARAKIDAVDLWIVHTQPFYDWIPYLDAPVIVVEYGTPEGHFFKPSIGRALDAMTADRLERLYPSLLPCDAIMSISHSIHNWLPEGVRSLSTVIHLGCDHFPKARPVEVAQLRRSLEVGAEDCLILWVGRMQLDGDEQPYKGFPELLMLIPFVQRRVPNCKFVLVGRVSDRDRQTLTARGLTVLANQTVEEMARIYAASDVLLNLSKWEGFNFALLEAQYQGTPVIAYDVGPHPEVVCRDETGLLVGKSRDLLPAVAALSSDADRRAAMSARAAAFAGRFTWQRSVSELAKLVEASARRRWQPGEVSAMRRHGPASEAPQSSGQPSEPVTARHGAVMIASRRLAKSMYRPFAGSDRARAAVAVVRQLRRDALQAIRAREKHGLPRRSRRDGSSMLVRWSGGARRGFGTRLAELRTRAGQLSPNRIALWFSLEERLFVRHAHRVLFGREPDEHTTDLWVDRLQAGESRSSVLRAMSSTLRSGPRPKDGAVRAILTMEALRQSVPWSAAVQRPDRTARLADGKGQRRPPALPSMPASDLPPRGRRAGEGEDVPAHGERVAAPAIPHGPRARRVPLQGAALLAAMPLRLGRSHVALVGLGTILEPTALRRLSRAVAETDGDIVYGDERDSDASRAAGLRTRGPFGHEAFLCDPDLGGVVAVHLDLLTQIGQSPSALLTGRVLLDLIALAHSICYLPRVLSRRSADDREGNRPSRDDMQVYLDRIVRPSILTERTGGRPGLDGYDVRFVAVGSWKAVVIVVSRDGTSRTPDLDSPLNHDPVAGLHAIVRLDVPEAVRVRTSTSPDRPPSPPADGPESSYSRRVNAAIRAAPPDCNLAVIMDAGVAPNSADWLERLGASALMPDTGAVAPVTLYGDGRIRHAGMATGAGVPCGYVHRFERIDYDAGGVERLASLREVSIVSRHCMMVRRSLFEDLGGFDEMLGPDACDIDFSLRLRAIGFSVFVDARVTATMPDAAPRWSRILQQGDREALESKHGTRLTDADPFHPTGLDGSGGKEGVGIATTFLPPIERR